MKKLQVSVLFCLVLCFIGSSLYSSSLFGNSYLDCQVDLGGIKVDPFVLCKGETLDPTVISDLDYFFESGIDSFGYYVYDFEGAAIDNFIAISNGSVIDQDEILLFSRNLCGDFKLKWYNSIIG